MRLLKWLEDVFWPRGVGCLCCDELCSGELLCSACSKVLDAMRLSTADEGDGEIRSVWRYESVPRQLVILLKDHCVADAAQVLAEEMADVIKRMNLPADTVLTWVTMPDRRRIKRGIDHGRTLCEAISHETGLPVKQMLIRTNNSHTQRGLSRKARLRNMENSIRCEKCISTPVLLIDDVLTTGATMSVCTHAIKEAGAPQVFALTATKVVLSKKG